MRGLGDLRNLMHQAQRLKQELGQRQQQLAEARVEATAGGGMVRAVVNGQGELIELHLSPEVVDPQEVEMLEDLLVAAVKQAQVKAKELAQDVMGDLAGGLPPGMGL
ncbi:MAG: YbaB/EbfC family nucleoid-associated protein [Candidatus Bipolaricaulaceae bacterium]